MKARTNKLISLALVLVMLASMIPMGMITANAAEADPNATEYVITTVDEWKAVAALKDLTNKTIKLGADIDAQGGSLPKFTSFVATTFDGCDYTIKNVNNTAAVITGMFYDNSVIKNVKLDNITITATEARDVGVIVAAASYSAGNVESTIKNVIATNCTVNATTCTNVGGLIGRIEYPAGSIVLQNLSVSGTLTADDGNVGGLVGYVNATGPLVIDGFYSGLALSNTTTYALTGSDYTHATGGVIGHLRAVKNAGRNVTIQDAYVAGTLTSTSNGVAGVVGYSEVTGGDLNFYNVAVACTAYNTDKYASSIFTNGKGGFNINQQNLYCNYGGYNGGSMMKWYFLDIWQQYITMNGGASFNKHYYNVAEDVINTYLCAYDGGVGVEPIDLTKVLKVDGYEITVLDHIYANAIQVSAVENGEFAVRFIAKSQRTDVNASDVTMNIVATTSGGVKKSFTSTCTLYDTLTEYNEKGIKGVKTAAEYEAQKLAALTIYGIPANEGETVTFEVTTSYKSHTGAIVTGTHTMTVTFLNGQLVQN